MQYNYVTSAGLDVGLAICAIILFFCVQLPGGEMPAYWGTNIVSDTLDGAGAAIRKVLPDGEYFGPRIGEFKW